ncbi:hypothetical protein LCGC14_1179780 [marine sediment metagenome]|uniref:Uncharacterized protein n=1 Tax=marine sediment metagenome TaxID=412755 RepID=A0A0F9MA86_9ZZZZ
MSVRVYAQYIGASALDARYLGTVEESPEYVAETLRNTENISYVTVHGNDVVAYGHKPF